MSPTWFPKKGLDFACMTCHDHHDIWSIQGSSHSAVSSSKFGAAGASSSWNSTTSPERTWVWVNTYRYILVGWTSIYQLFWGSLGTRVLTHPHMGTQTVRSIQNTRIISASSAASAQWPRSLPSGSSLHHQIIQKATMTTPWRQVETQSRSDRHLMTV
jgi:hypothetical protein